MLKSRFCTGARWKNDSQGFQLNAAAAAPAKPAIVYGLLKFESREV